MGGCPQTCMIKARIAPRSGAPAMLHTFVPRPASAALAALRCSVLMCGRSQMSARPDIQAYPSLRPLARCLIILVAMGGCPQTCMIKPRAASRVPRSHSAPPIRIPIFFAHSAQKISLCSCVGARKCPQDRICKHIRLCGRLLAV